MPLGRGAFGGESGTIFPPLTSTAPGQCHTQTHTCRASGHTNTHTAVAAFMSTMTTAASGQMTYLHSNIKHKACVVEKGGRPSAPQVWQFSVVWKRCISQFSAFTPELSRVSEICNFTAMSHTQKISQLSFEVRPTEDTPLGKPKVVNLGGGTQGYLQWEGGRTLIAGAFVSTQQEAFLWRVCVELSLGTCRCR